MISITVNDVKHDVDVPPEMPLLWVIRDELGMTGTKFGCGVAQCGACTMHIDGEATRTCVFPVAAAVGRQIHTIESLSTESIERRLAGALIRFCARLGTPEEDGSSRMMPFTHEMLSRYVGTSREIITHHMNHFRKQGYVSYSRRGILLYPQAMGALIN